MQSTLDFCSRSARKEVNVPLHNRRKELNVLIYILCRMSSQENSTKSTYMHTSHSAYAATETESNGAKIDGLLPPNFL